MSEAEDVAEALQDAQTYFSIGSHENAIGAVLDALFAHRSNASQAAISTWVADYAFRLWEAGKREEGKAFSNGVLEEMLKRTGNEAEPEYVELYATTLAETGTSPLPLRRLFRHRNLVSLFSEVMAQGSGEVVECGCARGVSILQLCLAFRRRRPDWQGEGFHVFDSFEGLSKPGPNDTIDSSGKEAETLAFNMQAGRFAVSLDTVRRNLHRLFPHVELHAGWIPDVFSGQPERSYRFVHVDVDLYQPTKDSLEYFYPRLEQRGVIITDDYNWPGGKKAFDEFSAQNELALQLTDTNQAFLVKQAGN